MNLSIEKRILCQMHQSGEISDEDFFARIKEIERKEEENKKALDEIIKKIGKHAR